MAGQAFFFAWEVKHQEGLVNGILDFQEKPWGGGEYIYQFGSLPTLEIRNGTVNYLEEKKNNDHLNSEPKSVETENSSQKLKGLSQIELIKLKKQLEQHN